MYVVAQIFQKLGHRAITNFLRLSRTYRVENRYRVCFTYRHDPEGPGV